MIFAYHCSLFGLIRSFVVAMFSVVGGLCLELSGRVGRQIH